MKARSQVVQHSLYGGRVLLEFDTVRHRYYVVDLDGRERHVVPGVTSILGVMNRPALINWAASQAAEYVAASLKPGEALDDEQIQALVDGARTAYRRTRDRAAEIGTVVHEWIERYAGAAIRGHRLRIPLPENEQARRGVEAFIGWTEAHDVKFLESERPIYSRSGDYAGTVDIIAEVNGVLSVLDVKTSTRVYPQYALQLAAYWLAWEEDEEVTASLAGREPRRIQQGLVVHVSKTNGLFAVHEMLPDRAAYHEAVEVFSSLIRVHRWRMSS